MEDCKGAAVAALVMLGGLGCGSDVATFGDSTTRWSGRKQCGCNHFWRQG